MKRLMLMAGAVLMVGVAFCRAQTVAPAASAAQPVPQIVQPPAQPIPAPGYSSVLVLPFVPISGGSEWMGKGIQEDLATELVRQSRLNVLTPPDAPAVSDPATAAKVGRDTGASLVAFGTFQIVDSDVRINGQLIDSATGKPIAGLKATGPRRDLFHMEDLLAAQAVAALPPGAIRVGGGQYANNSEPGAPMTSAPSASYTVEPANQGYNNQGYYVESAPQATPYVYSPTYSTPSDYPSEYVYPPYASSVYPYYDSYYGSPFWGSGFIFIGGGDHHHHWNGGGHSGGFVGVHGFNGTGSGFNGTGSGFNGTGSGFNGTRSGFSGSVRSSGFSGGFHGSFGGGAHGGGGGHR